MGMLSVCKYCLLTKECICIGKVFCYYGQYIIWRGRNGRFTGDFEKLYAKILYKEFCINLRVPTSGARMEHNKRWELAHTSAIMRTAT